MIKDATLERIWEARRHIYEKCGNDPVKLVEYYLKRQQKQSPDSPLMQNDVIRVIHPQEAVLSAD
ncbi:MAG: hypothetical protein HC887_06395 [Desulfobacteraceae bacterium]|nr:hypothetical protein [Desulfobacteraceae bacterium]